MQLNAERSPRETIYGEATQKLNPITGRPYADGSFTPQCESKRSFKKYPLEPIYEKVKNYEFIEKIKKPALFGQRPRTNPEIELQKALGRMEVRESGHYLFYGVFLSEIDRLADVYAKNPGLTLDSITDVNGLNAAIRAIEEVRKPQDEISSYVSQIMLSELPRSKKKYVFSS